MDVKAIYIHDTNTGFIPGDIGLLFNLTVLKMWNTQLIEIEAKSFQNMMNLELLSLYNNKLSSVPSNAFTELTKLKLLSLSSNQIQELPNGVFTNNVNLETIHLSTNKLKFLGSYLFDDKTKLKTVSLRGNVCINKDYSTSPNITELKNDIKMKCFNPNEVTATPSTTTQNPIELQERISNLIIELNKAKEDLEKTQIDLVTATIAQNNDQNELIKVRQELSDARELINMIQIELNNKDTLNNELMLANDKQQLELIECAAKVNNLTEEVSTLDQIGYKKLYDELLQVKEEQKIIGIEINQQHKEMIQKQTEMTEINTAILNLLVEHQSLQTELDKTNLKLKESEDKLLEVQMNLEANEQDNRNELNKAKNDLHNLQDELNESTLKCLNDQFTEEMKFIALERKFELAKEQLSNRTKN